MDSLGASLSADVSAGTYFLKITGVGQGDPAGTGYSDYGSLGQYTISGQVVEPPPSLSVSDVTVNENDGTATFTVSLSQALSQAVTVDVATADGTALGSSDYQAVSQTLTFDAGQTSKSVVVSILDDSVMESNETFTLQLSNATGGVSIFDGQGVGSIVDNDTIVYVNIGDVTLNEGNPKKGKNAGPRTTQATFTITLSEASNETVTVQYTTRDGTATSGSDYSFQSGSVTFAAGQMTQTVTIDVAGDGDVESDETFNLDLTGSTNATIADGQAIGTILNDDSSGGGGGGKKGGGAGGKGGGKKTLTVDASQSDDLSDTGSGLLTGAMARFNQQHRDSAPGVARAGMTAVSASGNWRLTSVLDSSDGEANPPWQRVSEGFQFEPYDG